MQTKIKGLLMAMFLMHCAAAGAVEYRQVQAGASSVAFTYAQMGVAMEGKFKNFTAQLAFDPARPEHARATIEIDIASIDTGMEDANEEVVGKQWFDVRTYPAASFVASAMKSLGGNHYEARGKLNIKGRTQDVVVPVTFRTDGARALFGGVLNIRRLDYAIGVGAWSDVSAVADEISIKFNFVVTAAPEKK